MQETAGKATERDLSKFNHFFKWNRILLKIIGIWPLEAEVMSKFEKFRAVYLTAVLAFVIASQWADLFVIWGQFDLMIDNLSTNLMISLALCKILVIRCHFKTLQYCCTEVRNDWCADDTSVYLQGMLRQARIGRIFSIASPAFSITVAMLYSVLPLTLTISSNGTEIIGPFPLRAVYFFDPTWTPRYEIVYFAQTTACYMSSISHSAIDSFLAALALHACGQFQILGQKLRAADNKKPLIRNLMEHHLRLIKFAEQLENVYSIIIFGQLLVSSLAICSIGYRFIMIKLSVNSTYLVMSIDKMDQLSEKETLTFRSLVDGIMIEMAKFSLYLTAVLIEIFIYCYAGQYIIDESTRLSEAVYDCKWYDMKPSDAKALWLMLLRAQFPLQITAMNFCIMSHQCFADILSRSVTYLSVLRAVKTSV